MDVWEKLTALIARWQRRPLQYLGLLHNATICMQVRTATHSHSLSLTVVHFGITLLCQGADGDEDQEGVEEDTRGSVKGRSHALRER